MKASHRRTKTIEKWAKMVLEWKQSSKKAKEWCREWNIGYTQFIAWRKRLERMNAEESSSMFVEVQNEKAPEPLEICFCDFTITIPEQFNKQTLLNCLRVLKSL